MLFSLPERSTDIFPGPFKPLYQTVIKKGNAGTQVIKIVTCR